MDNDHETETTAMSTNEIENLRSQLLAEASRSANAHDYNAVESWIRSWSMLEPRTFGIPAGLDSGTAKTDGG